MNPRLSEEELFDLYSGLVGKLEEYLIDLTPYLISIVKMDGSVCTVVVMAKAFEDKNIFERVGLIHKAIFEKDPELFRKLDICFEVPTLDDLKYRRC